MTFSRGWVELVCKKGAHNAAKAARVVRDDIRAHLFALILYSVDTQYTDVWEYGCGMSQKDDVVRAHSYLLPPVHALCGILGGQILERSHP